MQHQRRRAEDLQTECHEPRIRLNRMQWRCPAANDAMSNFFIAIVVMRFSLPVTGRHYYQKREKSLEKCKSHQQAPVPLRRIR